MRRYQTSIKSLMQARTAYCKKNGVEPIFLSDWDSDYRNIQIPNLMYYTQPSNLQKYYFWTDEENYRINIQNFFSKNFSQLISKDCFTIGSNGTSSIMLSLTALKESGKQRALVLTPTYFSTLNLLDKLDFDVVEYDLTMRNNFSINVEKLENIIIQNKIDTIIITNPIFGSGIEVDVKTIKEIAIICNSQNVCLFMDYVYGGMQWHISNPINYIFQYSVFEAVSSSEQYIFVESISKRVFLNGTKFSLVFSSPSFMRRILRLSIFMVGSMAFQQVNLIPQIYSDSSVYALTNLIAENAVTANNCYNMIKALLTGTPAAISNANCGYFALISIPQKHNIDDTTYAIDILNKTGIITIPHSRYLYKEKGYYSFRINLLLDKHDLIEGVTKIRNLE